MGLLTRDDFVEELQARGFNGFGTASLERYVRFGYWHVLRTARFSAEMRTDQVFLSPGVTEMGFTSMLNPVASIHKVYVTTGDHERELTLIDEDEYYSNWAPKDISLPQFRGEPRQYFVGKSSVIILPPPIEGRTVKVEYWGGSDLDAPSSTSILPDSYDEAILEAAIIRCHVRAREPDEAQAARSRLDELFNDLLIEEGLRVDAAHDRVKPWIRS